jgi:hypothetical protein
LKQNLGNRKFVEEWRVEWMPRIIMSKNISIQKNTQTVGI